MSVSSDLAFLASPPASFSPSGAAALSNTFGYVQSLVRDFELSFVYIKGFDVYTVQVRYVLLCFLVNLHQQKGINTDAWSRESVVGSSKSLGITTCAS